MKELRKVLKQNKYRNGNILTLSGLVLAADILTRGEFEFGGGMFLFVASILFIVLSGADEALEERRKKRNRTVNREW